MPKNIKLPVEGINKTERIHANMKCPECGKEMKKGIVEVRDGSLFLTSVVVSWCPEDERKKLLRKNAISLMLNAEGHYCDECMKVFAAFEERSF